jgi:hypothetical protein
MGVSSPLRPEWVSSPPVIRGHCKELRSARIGTVDGNALAAELAGKVRTALQPHLAELARGPAAVATTTGRVGTAKR